MARGVSRSVDRPRDGEDALAHVASRESREESGRKVEVLATARRAGVGNLGGGSSAGSRVLDADRLAAEAAVHDGARDGDDVG